MKGEQKIRVVDTMQPIELCKPNLAIYIWHHTRPIKLCKSNLAIYIIIINCSESVIYCHLLPFIVLDTIGNKSVIHCHLYYLLTTSTLLYMISIDLLYDHLNHLVVKKIYKRNLQDSKISGRLPFSLADVIFFLL